MAKKALLTVNRWTIEKIGDGFKVTYQSPKTLGKESQLFSAEGSTAEAAFLNLPGPIRCIPSADAFLEEARKQGLIEKPDVQEAKSSGSQHHNNDVDEKEW